MCCWTTIGGCYFYYKQALWRKLAQSDLVPEYKVAGPDVRKSFQIIVDLPFVPNGDVDFFAQLFLLRIEMFSFADYMDYTWIGIVPSSDFPEAPTSLRAGTTGSKPGRLLPSYNLKILGGVEAGASFHRHEVL